MQKLPNLHRQLLTSFRCDYIRQNLKIFLVNNPLDVEFSQMVGTDCRFLNNIKITSGWLLFSS